MKHAVATIVVLMFVLSAAPTCAWGASDAMVSGVVRDAHGTPQLGALVELVGSDASVVAQAFTDDHGRYLLNGVLPGSYQLRASAAFLLPAMRGNLRVRAGVRAVADLTMTAIFEAGAWLPTEGRRSSEPADDWRWTLRSTANRPLLRVASDNAPPSRDQVSSSMDHPAHTVAQGRVALLAGDGSFGNGGAHEVVTLDKAGLGGDVSVLRASVGESEVLGAGVPVALSAGLERERTFGGETRIVVDFASHPELVTGEGDGLQVLHAATTEKFSLGDVVLIDAGTLVTAERLLESRFSSAPYLRAAIRVSPEFALEYRLATDRALQRSADLDQMAVPDETLGDEAGRPILRKGLHQEIAATDTREKTVLSLAIYRDALPIEGVQGGGALTPADLADNAVIADPATETFRVALRGYSSTGLRVVWDQSLTSMVSACMEGDLGSALATDGTSMKLDALSDALRPRLSAALSAGLRLSATRTGTAMNVRYRWQPAGTLTQVDEFDAEPGDAFLGVTLRQKLWSGKRLRGVNAVVEATNLLGQGYEAFVGSDGETLFLAQVPRGVQGGLAFSF